MKTDWHDLIQRHIAGLATEVEITVLHAALKTDDAVARLYLRHMNLDVALEAHSESKDVVNKLLFCAQTAMPDRSRDSKSWRPLTAAAAGIVFGMLCTSVVFGLVVQRVGEKKTPLPVVEPGFENAAMPLAKDFPDSSAHWGGDPARVVAAEHGVPPKEGKFMLRLEPMSKGAPRIYQVLDLQAPPLDVRGEFQEIEVSASFASGDAGASVRYVIRAFALTEEPEGLNTAWLDLREEAIASVARGLDVVPGSHGWQTVTVKLQVPRAARSLVLFFGVRTPDKTARTAPHYLDDVQVSLLTTTMLP